MGPEKGATAPGSAPTSDPQNATRPPGYPCSPVGSLWRGSSLILTASQLATYNLMKEAILGSGAMRDGLETHVTASFVVTHVTASFVAGFVAALASNPVDVIKTREMKMKPSAYSWHSRSMTRQE